MSMFRKFARGKDSSPAKPVNQSPSKKDEKPQDAEGFLCPMCMARLPGPAELQSHFEKVHSEGGGNVAQMPDEPEPNVGQLINIAEDNVDLGQKAQLQFSSSDSTDEVVFLQQEMTELATAIKEEKWYSGQLKDELDKVSKERDRLEEEKEMFQQEYDSKLRSAEESYLQVASENEKLKDELRYADIKSIKERDTRLNADIEGLKMSLSQEKEMRSAVEEANKHMMMEIERKDKDIDALNVKLKESPSNDRVITLENEIKSLRESLQNSEKQNEKNSEEEIVKWRKNVDELKVEIARQEILIKELELEKAAKGEQVQTVQNTLNAALETSKQSQQQTQEKQQQIIDLQHETREAQTALKEKAAFVAHLEKQLEDSKVSLALETQEKHELQQKNRNLQNSLDAGSRDSNEKDAKLKDLENMLVNKKSELQRLESERSDLLAKIEAGEGVETAINQLRQEKEKLLENISKSENEMAEQGRKYTTEIDILRGDKSKLKEDVEGLSDRNKALEKQLSAVEGDLAAKQKSIEELKQELRDKAGEIHQIELKSSQEKASFEEQVQQLGQSLSEKSNQITVLEQKLAKVSIDLSSMTSSKSEVDKVLQESRNSNEALNKDLAKANTDLQELKALHKKESEELKGKIEQLNVALGEKATLLQKEGGEKKNLEISLAKTEAELNAKIAIGDKDIAVLKAKIEEDTKEREKMDKEFADLRENEASLKTKVQSIEIEFQSQKDELNQRIMALKTKSEGTEAQLKTELQAKEIEMKTAKESSKNQIEELKKSFAEKEVKFKEDLKLKDGELFFISESTKETIAGYEKSLEMLEGTLKDEQQKSEQLQLKINKIEEEKTGILASLEQKDATLHDAQRKLEVAEAELKKKCESCKNYEIQLCRFQETHKEQINTVATLEEQIKNLSADLKTSKETRTGLEAEFEKHKQSANENDESLRKELEQSKEVNAVLDARVLELDDELKEAYNKYDNAKTEVATLSTDLAAREEHEAKLREENLLLEKEIEELKAAEENFKNQAEKEKEYADQRIAEILRQKSEDEEEFNKMRDLLEKEKKESARTRETMEKMQIVLKERIESILTKVQNIEREKEDLLKSKEQSETRLNMEIKSLTENINRSRQEIENRNKKIEEFNQQMSNIQKEKDDLRGDVAVMEVQIQNINEDKKALTERVLQSEDAHKRTKERLSDTNRRLEQSLAALQELGQENQSIQMQQNFKLSRQWEDDNLAKNCKTCDKLFSLTVRKHHCRHCGGIFCNECSNNYTQVAASKKAVRVCDHCHTELNTVRGRRVSAASMT
ncbi:early endosome antigen 1-like [Rhopilema esculentum]|uniref:early endosome antigen 1-like n=1 Tax=Rhopilema esculentum TaxID=499914 RepID=UPI0031D939DB